MSQDTLNAAVTGIIHKLGRDENRDLLGAVVSHMGENDSFMFTFKKVDKLDFDGFCFCQHQLDMLVKAIEEANGEQYTEDVRSMSARYDEYLNTDEPAALSAMQSARFEEIISSFDNGWSGAIYGLVMREVQRQLRLMMSN